MKWHKYEELKIQCDIPTNKTRYCIPDTITIMNEV